MRQWIINHKHKSTGIQRTQSLEVKVKFSKSKLKGQKIKIENINKFITLPGGLLLT